MSSDPNSRLSHSFKNSPFRPSLEDRMRARARTDSGSSYTRVKYAYYQAVTQTVDAVLSLIDQEEENESMGGNARDIPAQLLKVQQEVEHLKKLYQDGKLTIESLKKAGYDLKETPEGSLFDLEYGQKLYDEARAKEALLPRLLGRYACYSSGSQQTKEQSDLTDDDEFFSLEFDDLF